MLVTRIGKRKIYTKWHNIQYIHLVQLSMVPRLLRCSIAKWKPCNSFSSFFYFYSLSLSQLVPFFSSSYSSFGSWFNPFYTFFFLHWKLIETSEAHLMRFPNCHMTSSFFLILCSSFFGMFLIRIYNDPKFLYFFSTILFRISLISIRKKNSVPFNRIEMRAFATIKWLSWIFRE